MTLPLENVLSECIDCVETTNHAYMLFIYYPDAAFSETLDSGLYGQLAAF